MLRMAMLLASAMLLLPRPGAAADAAAGKRVFARCAVCHAIEAGAERRVGPNLHGIFGRTAGTFNHYPYSPAMKKSGVVWSDATLAQFVRNPRTFIPGANTAFPGIKDETDIADLLAYLHQAAQ